MKLVRNLTVASLCASLCLVCGFAQAQQAAPAKAPQAQPAAKQAALLVGVVDMRSILQAHPIVAEQVPGLAQEMQKLSVEFAKKNQEAEQQFEQIQQQFKVGSPEFEAQIAPVRKTLSEAKMAAESEQQKFIAQRTQMMYQAYKDIQAAIQAVATQKGIIIVHSKIKYGADTNLSEEVVALEEADQNPIVWHRQECDITEAVKAQLAAKVGAPKTQETAAASSPLSNLGSQAMQAANAPVAPRAAGNGLGNGAAPVAPRTANAAGAAPRR